MMSRRTAIDVVELTRQLVRLPSVNPMDRVVDPDVCGESRVTDFLVQLFEREGITIYRDTVHEAQGELPRRENVLAYLPGKGDKEQPPESLPTLLLDAHQDTVPIDGMTVEPFEANQTEGRMYGRGSCDVKGGLASMVSALLQIRNDDAVRPNIVLACTVNEEFGFTGARRLRELWHSGECPFLKKAPDHVVVAEPTLLDVIVAHKGVVRWRCHTEGIATHSSAPQNGKNAIYSMAKIVVALEEYAANIVGTVATHPLVDPPTMNVGGIEGGISFNTVPDHCEIRIGRRLCPQEDPADARQHVIDYLKETLPEIELIHSPIEFESRGLVDEHNGELAKQLLASAAECGFERKAIGVQFATNAAVYCQDAPTVVFGPGSIEQAHTKDEWIDETQLPAAVNVLVEFLTNYGA